MHIFVRMCNAVPYLVEEHEFKMVDFLIIRVTKYLVIFYYRLKHNLYQ